MHMERHWQDPHQGAIAVVLLLLAASFGRFASLDQAFQGSLGRVADVEDLLQINRSARSRIEDCVSEKTAKEIIRRLPEKESDIESMIQAGYSLAKNMSWDVVVKNYLLPGLQKALHKQHSEYIHTRA